jgi:hypothetical protein
MSSMGTLDVRSNEAPPGEAVMFLAAVLRSLPLPWPWQAATPRALPGLAAPTRVLQRSTAPQDLRLVAGQTLMLKLARGTVMHVQAGVVDVEDAPALWADQCWPQARRFRSGEVWVVPRTGWWRLEGRVSRDPACRISARPPAARRSRLPRPY